MPRSPTLTFSAVLLAGGQSRRMGRDKAGVLWRGEPLWQRQLGTLRACGAAEIFISGHASGPYSAADVPIVLDRTPGGGPLAGIAAALRHARHEHVLVLAIDLPEITSAFLRDLLAQAAAAAIVPRDAHRFEPLAAIYTRACLPLAGACLRDGSPSLQRFAAAAIAQGIAGAHVLTPAECPLFHNVNTPSDLQPAD